MSPSSRFATFWIAIFIVCSCSAFPQHIDSGVIPGRTGIPEAGKKENNTVSVATLQAPQTAIRAYEKAKDAFSKDQLDIAERELKKATTAYPQFGLAWILLGRIHDTQARLEQAQADYWRALSADSRLARPYRRLAEIAFENKKWPDVVRLTNELIKIRSSDVPVAYLYNSAANFNMGNLDAAELSGRRFLSLDAKHGRPQAYLLLGDILQQKGEYQEAAQQMKMFLVLAPNDRFADAIRKEANRLKELHDEISGTRTSNLESH